MGLFQKVMTRKLCQNENFENGGIIIQIGILQVLLNILSISLLSGPGCVEIEENDTTDRLAKLGG